MEVVLAESQLDELFEKTAQTGYTKEILFSTLVNMMIQVVCSVRQSMGAVYKGMADELGVSKSAVYGKLNRARTKCQSSTGSIQCQRNDDHYRASRRSTASSVAQVSSENSRWQWSPEPRSTGYQCYSTRELEQCKGKSLVVLDPVLGLAIDIFPCEDGYTQERALLSEVLATVEAGDLWIGDRNFCTQEFLLGVAQKQATFIIRQHQNLPTQEISELVAMGRTEGGELFEQTVVVAYEGSSLRCRRVLLKLDKPTRNGETQIALLTNLTPAEAFSTLVAQLYRKRWRVETLFQVATQTFHCEIKTLGYPRAALFSFSMALVAYNLFSCLKGVLASVHGTDFLDKLSYYYLADELEGTYRGMMIALPPEDWQDLGQISLTQLSSLLQEWAQSLNLKAFTSAPRKPKKKKPKPPYDPRHPHVSTARLLTEKKSRASPNK